MAINSPKLKSEKQTVATFDGIEFKSITHFKNGAIPTIEKGRIVKVVLLVYFLLF